MVTVPVNALPLLSGFHGHLNLNMERKCVKGCTFAEPLLLQLQI